MHETLEMSRLQLKLEWLRLPQISLKFASPICQYYKFTFSQVYKEPYK